jgi:alpha/beta superfamily hydrolase
MEASESALLRICAVPKFLITSTHDQYAPRARMEELYAGIAEPKQVIWIDSRDHFFDGALDQLEQTIFALR